MGNTDSLPVVSQTKSLVQFIAGDSEGARQTQLNFVKGCPVISQGVALGAVIAGDTKYALETQEYFLNNVSNMADSIPVVGHVKGTIHYACGDIDGGDNAMKAASRTVGVAAGGIGGFVIGGPVGAVAGGISGGAAMDTVISAVDSAVHDEQRLYGHIYSLKQAIDGEITPGEAFDWAATPLFDGLTGYSYGKMYRDYKMSKARYERFNSSIKDFNKDQLAREIQSAARELKEAVEQAKKGDVSKTTFTRVIDVDGNRYDGYSYRLRNALNVDAFDGDVTSTQQILSEKFPRGTPKIRGVVAGQPGCAEHHALNQFHKVNGNHAVPRTMITIQYDGKNYYGVPRCNNCMKIGKSIPMGNVVTDSMNGVPVPTESVVSNACLNTLVAELCDVCDCDYPHEDDE